MTVKELRKALRGRLGNMPVVMAFRNHDRIELSGIWSVEEQASNPKKSVSRRLVLKTRAVTGD